MNANIIVSTLMVLIHALVMLVFNLIRMEGSVMVSISELFEEF